MVQSLVHVGPQNRPKLIYLPPVSSSVTSVETPCVWYANFETTPCGYEFQEFDTPNTRAHT